MLDDLNRKIEALLKAELAGDVASQVPISFAGRGFEFVNTSANEPRMPCNIDDHPYASIWCGAVTATNNVTSSDFRMKRGVETLTGALQSYCKLARYRSA
jgi:hypothetical protein